MFEIEHILAVMKAFDRISGKGFQNLPVFFSGSFSKLMKIFKETWLIKTLTTGSEKYSSFHRCSSFLSRSRPSFSGQSQITKKNQIEKIQKIETTLFEYFETFKQLFRNSKTRKVYQFPTKTRRNFHSL